MTEPPRPASPPSGALPPRPLLPPLPPGVSLHRHEASGRDPGQWHGHKILTRHDLDEVFADDPPRRSWRHVVHGVVLSVLAALIIAAVLFAWAVATGRLEISATYPKASAPPAAAACPTATLSYPANNTVQVNVYNGTQTQGLAANVAAQLTARGYQAGQTGNRDIGQTQASAVIISGPAGEAGAFNLERIIPGSVYLPDGRTDAGVDVILTGGFKDLVPPEQVDRTPGTLSCPQLRPTPAPAASAPAPAEPAPAESGAPAG